MPRTLPAFTCIAFALSLSACQILIPAERLPLAVEHGITEHRPPGCHDERCPLVNIDRQTFPDEPALDALIDQRLRQMTRQAPNEPLPASLAEYERDFLATAAPGWSTWLQAKVRDWQGSRVVIELSSYLQRDGAHGQPGRGFITYDWREDRELKLADLLVPGKEGAFWRLAEEAHRQWLLQNGLNRQPGFADQWPFRRTANIALLRDRVLLKYDVYAIAPYASGHPELSIGYDRLAGILREQYLP